MSGSLGGKRKGSQGNKNGKWPEGAIKEEDEEVIEDDIADEIEGYADGDELGRGSYDIAELDAVRRASDADQQSISASV